MRIKDGFKLRKIANNYMVVPIGSEAVDFNGMITLNEVGAFVWEKLQNDATEEEIVSAILSEYDVDREIASADVANYISKLKEKGIVI